VNLLVDSSVWLWTMGKKVIPGIVKYLEGAESRHRIMTTGMIRLEVAMAAAGWNQLLELNLLFSRIDAAEAMPETWDEAGRLRMRMKMRGMNLKAADLLIASVALEHNLTVLHADQDFEYLAQHEGLKTESLLHLVE
jgi:predicted nucleic acid-binding protein